MLFEEVYNSVILQHYRDAENLLKEGQAIRLRLRELRGADALNPVSELSSTSGDECAAHDGFPSPPSAESSAIAGIRDIRFTK